MNFLPRADLLLPRSTAELVLLLALVLGFATSAAEVSTNRPMPVAEAAKHVTMNKHARVHAQAKRPHVARGANARLAGKPAARSLVD